MHYVPEKKRSKKAQKELNAKQRITWGTVNPSTKIFPNTQKFCKNKRSQQKSQLKELMKNPRQQYRADGDYLFKNQVPRTLLEQLPLPPARFHAAA